MTPNKSGDEPKSVLPMIPNDQWVRVMHQEMCDIDPGFMGFMEVYEALSRIIPKHWTVVDLGCAYNPQCFFFEKHARYIAVDQGKWERFQSANCEIHAVRIDRFITKSMKFLNLSLDTTFAICSYVPADEATMNLVRSTFKNLFVYYPCGDEKIILRRKSFA